MLNELGDGSICFWCFTSCGKSNIALETDDAGHYIDHEKKTDFVCAEPLVRGWSKNATISENCTGEATIYRQIFFALEYVAGTNTKLNKLKIQFYQHEQGAGKNA